MAEKLTKRVVDAAQTKDKAYIVWDTLLTGFGLKVTPAGSKIYLLYYRTSSGRQRKPKIANHGTMTVDQARETAKQWLYKLANGIDISEDRQNDRQAETVADLGHRYLRDYAEVHKKPSSIKADRANLVNHVIPLIGRLKVKEVQRPDIERLKLDIRDGKSARKLPAKPRGRRIVVGGTGSANRVLALLSKMFACAIDWGLTESNPAVGIKKFKEQRRDRFLDASEVASLHHALDQVSDNLSEHPSAVSAIRMLLYTGLRLTEITDLTWQDVNFERATIRLRDSKTGARTVPLNGLAIDVLRNQQSFGGSIKVFEGTTAGKPITLTRPWYRIRALANIDDTANLHCLRHTFASWAVMSGQSLPQVGALLGHKSAQTTLRYADHATDALRGYSEQTANEFRRLTSPE